MPTFRGRCHCGNITLEFETAQAAEKLALRACACSFCRRHGARCATDPAGRVHLAFRDPDRVVRYRFGLATADFLICAACGVYVGAVMRDGERAWATINVNTFDGAGLVGREAASVDYDAESEAERLARRRARWTPVAAIDEGGG